MYAQLAGAVDKLAERLRYCLVNNSELEKLALLGNLRARDTVPIRTNLDLRVDPKITARRTLCAAWPASTPACVDYSLHASKLVAKSELLTDMQQS
jgi:hypothetical protein